MLTKNEITSLSLSPTKKDFVQIWNELLEVAGKLSERWDPTSTNESDPGIVILKALAGIADKLNYNIDKNTLEAFMPTAAQEDSMRKLCDMLGYNVKYYRSAKTKVTIKYHNPKPEDAEVKALQKGLVLPKFSVISNSDQDINYFTLNETPFYLTDTTPYIDVDCMEGQIVKCESINDNNVISASQVSENNRFYLPETQIAENGIFVYNIFNYSELPGGSGLEDGQKWEKVDNLNVQAPGKRVFKFGFDSYESRPYLEFPEDYSELFGDGIFIYYTRTSGAAGNVSARTLTKLEFPTNTPEINGKWSDVSANSISIENPFSTNTGANVETIKQAYNNFKKTIGTFETLVTCRDYMNKIYTMLNEVDKPIVSNILVTDIRNDLNRAITICSCDRAGIFFKELPVTKRDTTSSETYTETTNYSPTETDEVHTTTQVIEVNKPFYAGRATTVDAESTNWYLPPAGTNGTGIPLTRALLFGDGLADAENFDMSKNGEVSEGTGDFLDWWVITQSNVTYKTAFAVKKSERVEITKQAITKEINRTVTNTVTETPSINHFDLVLYPFKSYSQIKGNVKDVRSVYDASFNYSDKSFTEIEQNLKADSIQTIAHSLVKPREGDIVSINNYLKLNATIATTSKITIEEGSILIDKIKIALANAFNMRELDFGEEIPFESIVEVMEEADAKIKMVSLNEPALYTTFSVFTGYENGAPVIKEYAVASEWLTHEQARNTDRFDMDKYTVIRENGENKIISDSTFNTVFARTKYNDLVVRNVLAARVPLFDYHKTFKTSFFEAAYQVTEQIGNGEVPDNVRSQLQPTEQDAFVVFEHGDITYAAQYVGKEIIDEVETDIIRYFKTFTPENLVNSVIDNINTKKITDISTECKIFTHDGEINGLTLAGGEFVKFRAPNFTTIKTYPAYVNYHLALNNETKANAVNANASSLFEILNKDRLSYTLTKPINNWQRAIDFFDLVDRAESRPENSRYRQQATQTQSISKWDTAAATSDGACSRGGSHIDNGSGVCSKCGARIMSAVQKSSSIIVDIDDENLSQEQKDIAAFLDLCGCIKIGRNHAVSYDANEDKFLVKAIVKWKPAADGSVPSEKDPDVDISVRLSSLFIISSSVIVDINNAVQKRLEEMVGQVKADGVTPMLPREGDWTISFEYEGVPFEPKSLAAWQSFIQEQSATLMGFTPYAENNTVFWRLYGEGYNSGKYILQSSEKLLAFNKNYFGLLPEARTKGIYLIQNVGSDAESAIIANGEEYRLRADEYLYIEYTPSTTSEDGTSKEADAVTEILGEGTIIKPSGFEVGIKDSSMLASEGVSPHKTVTFETETGERKDVQLHRFGANEQVEIRDFARVTLSKDTFKASPNIWYYKNFNDCPLDITNYDGPRSYTLKDGEYIFYTDQNKTELAYFTTGTEVSLTGSLILDTFDVIELASVFDTGMSEIPWKRLRLNAENDSMILQEFQYITLGPNDTIKKIKLVNNADDAVLTDVWQYCEEVTYSLAGSDAEEKLEAINTYDDTVDSNKGCGWEASSAFELDVSYSSSQSLRKTDQIQTSLKLYPATASGNITDDVIEITPEDAGHPLAFKTNLTCQTSSTNVNIKDIYSNPNKVDGFEVKVFAKDLPVLVETMPNRTVPFDKTVTDLTAWKGKEFGVVDTENLWQELDLTKITVKPAVVDEEKPILYDNALRLPASILPNTYGVFSILLDITSDAAAAADMNVWIELPKGVSKKSISIVNITEAELATRWYKNAASCDCLRLHRGINCIRVNKTGRIFIKASENIQGALFFDNLKLVNCQTISYNIPAEASGNKNELIIPTETYGLNIKQLGYLNPADADSVDDALAVDADIKKTLIKNRVNDTKAKLTTKAKAKKAAFASPSKDLQEYYSRLDTVTSIVTSAVKEVKDILDQLKPDGTTYDPALVDAFYNLFNKYNTLHQKLVAEQELMESLTENANINAFEANLSSLLEQLASQEDLQAKLKEELIVLKESVSSELAGITRDAVLEDLDIALNTNAKSTALLVADSSKTELVQELEKASKELVDLEYNAKLLPLIESINNVVNSEDKIKLFTIISTLKDNSLAASQLSLLTKVKQIIEAADNSEVNSMLDTMMSAATEPDYRTLISVLNRLKAYTLSSNFNALITELDTAISSSNNEHAKTIVTELKTLLSSNSTNITTAVDALLTKLSGKVSVTVDGTTTQINYTSPGCPEDTTVTTSVKALYNTATTEYRTKLTTLLKSIEDIIDDMTTEDDAYSSAIASLQGSDDSQVESILTDIESLAAFRESKVETIDDFSTKIKEFLATSSAVVNVTKINTLLPHGEEAAYRAWRKHLNTSLVDNCNTVATELLNVIKLFAYMETNYSLIPSIIPNSRSAFKAFDIKVRDTIYAYNQNKSYTDIINNLPFVESSALKTAVSSLEAGSTQNSTLCECLKAYSAASGSAKQTAAKALKEALNADISVLTKIVSAIVAQLCPSLLNIKAKLPDAFSKDTKVSDFYTGWVTEISNSYNKFVTANTGEDKFTAALTTLLSDLEVFGGETSYEVTLRDSLKKNELYAWLLKAPDYDDSTVKTVLPDEVTELLIELRKLALVQDKAETFISHDFDTEFETELEKTEPESSPDYTGIISNWLNDKLPTDALYDEIRELTDEMLAEIALISKLNEVSTESKDAYNYLLVERQLLADIMAKDIDRNFYYTAPVDLSLAIDFNESDAKLNTLQNPATNYDVNNANNSFVISKLDIDYLDKGLQLSRSSRLN